MDVSIWDVLGIAETRDTREIKRAYATQLRVTPPEDDPAGYMRLRDAYEAAKNYAAYAQDDDPGEEPRTQPELVVAPAHVLAPAPSPTAAPEANGHPRPRPSPQRQAFADLDSLLSEGKLDEFLGKVQAIQDAQTFSTLDEQSDFIGEVSQLVQNADIEDMEWRGRLAEALGARERDNIFAEGSEYWYAYGELLHSYSEMKSAATIAHAQDQDEIGARPGYLHVYHVLTAPFDSERLMALTRSQTYHRLAQGIIERSKTDPAIVIPPENRDWWERTAMAGQHRPAAAEPAGRSTATESSSFPGWLIWIVVMVMINGIRMCHDNSSPRTTRFEPPQSSEYMLPSGREMPAVDSEQMRRVLRCDPQTRAALYRHRFKVSTQDTDTNRLRFVWDESDPVVAALLAKCPPPP